MISVHESCKKDHSKHNWSGRGRFFGRKKSVEEEVKNIFYPPLMQFHYIFTWHPITGAATFNRVLP